jgi:hypothetical protein
MTTYARVQGKVYKGYAKAASELGSPYNVYRSTTGLTPIAVGNFVSTVLMTANVSWNYMKANAYGNSVWQLIVDGRIVNVGDYLVENSTIDSILPSTFFIIAKQEILPILGIKCDRVITITEPNISMSKGPTEYGGYTKDDVITLMQNCPCSFITAGKGEEAEAKLPTDAKLPMFFCFVPFLGGVQIKTGHIITDQTGTDYIVTTNELTELGWRLSIRKRGV